MSLFASLQDIMDQSRQRADQVNSVFVEEVELILAVNASAKELHDLLVTAYGEEYYYETVQSNFTVDDPSYPLPANFFKLAGVDIETGSGTAKFWPVDKFSNRHRNRDVVFAYTGLLLKYRLRGGSLIFAPPPRDGRAFKIHYTPTARKLIKQSFEEADVIFASDRITLTAHGLLAGAPIQFTTTTTLPSPLVTNTVNYVLVVDANTIQVALTEGGAAIVLTDAGTGTHTALSAFDGINGWENYIVVDVARKMLDKEESDSRHLSAEKQEIIGKLEQLARNRDSGEPEQITDVDPLGLSDEVPLRHPLPL